MPFANIDIKMNRLSSELEQLARFSEADPPAVTRILFSEPDLKARAYLKGLFTSAGLFVREDPAGNIFARWQGSDASLPAVATGSHTDAIPFSGRFDGTVGVLGGLEAIRALKDAGLRPKRSIELIMFTSEEPTRFGIGCIGSRLMSGSLAPEKAGSLKDSSGATFDEVRRSAGYSGSLAAVKLAAGHYAAFVELHIEQGPLLEREGLPIGAVTAIAAPATLRVRLEGESGHAGGVLMPQRKDALCAAAEVILAVEKAAHQTGRVDTVGTTGVCQVHPSAVNAIPGKVLLEIDIRDTQLEARDQVVHDVRQAIEDSARRRQIVCDIETINADPPAEAGRQVVAAIENVCRGTAMPFKLMVSRAYHDSLFMARICPTGMIFIPCKNGVSHRPDEYTSPESIATGAKILALTLAELAE